MQKQQIAHFDLEDETDTAKLTYQLNSVLPKSIGIKSIRKVKSDAHARFDATTPSI